MKKFKEFITEKKGVKLYYLQQNVGRAKYVVSYYDGKTQHKDGSDFYSIKIFKNKPDAENFISDLQKDGYRKKSPLSEQLDCIVEATKTVVVKHDGKVVYTAKDQNDAFRYIHKNQSQSVDWAMKHEGWSIEEK